MPFLKQFTNTGCKGAGKGKICWFFAENSCFLGRMLTNRGFRLQASALGSPSTVYTFGAVVVIQRLKTARSCSIFRFIALGPVACGDGQLSGLDVGCL